MLILRSIVLILDFAMIGICVLGIIADKMTNEENRALGLLSILVMLNIYFLIAEIRW